MCQSVSQPLGEPSFGRAPVAERGIDFGGHFAQSDKTKHWSNTREAMSHEPERRMLGPLAHDLQILLASCDELRPERLHQPERPSI